MLITRTNSRTFILMLCLGSQEKPLKNILRNKSTILILNLIARLWYHLLDDEYKIKPYRFYDPIYSN